MTDPDEQTIACDGDCKWVQLDEFKREFAELEDRDPVSYDFLVVLMDAAAGEGIGPEDYKAPIGRRLVRRERPWIGEFRVDGPTDRSGRCEQHRMYFGEAPVDRKSLAACLIGSKPSKTLPHIWRPKQDRHIGWAMDRLRAWCRRSDVTCRMLGR
ncbi:hypothetical protein [Nocardia asiatica]|uniref:hypothetical protein n=1 Tax=Nocardia asiatica TaxID=209252 RepID=UPI00245582C6|nr:hypothetical protein [Nocardia asiatica]